MACGARGPGIFGDETAYLGTARFLAGQAADLQLASPGIAAWPFYSAGYSLLLAPLAGWLATPAATFRAALAVNAGLAAGTFVLLTLFARRVLQQPARQSLLLALVACCYPALFLQPGHAWSEALLFLLLPAMVLALHRLLRGGGWPKALAFSLLSTFAYATHQRNLGLLGLCLAIYPLLWRRRQISAATAGIGLGVALVGGVATRALNRLVWAHLYSHGVRFALADALARLRTQAGLLDAAASALGQLWYLLSATCGLFLLGLWAAARPSAVDSLDGDPAEGSAQRGALGYLLAATLILLGTSAGFMIGANRADHLIYGRYVEPVVGLLLVCGLARLGGRWPSWVGGIAVGAPILLGLSLIEVRDAAAWSWPLNQLNVLGLAGGIIAMGRLRILWLAALGAGGALLTLGLARWRPTFGRAAAGAVFAAGTATVLTFATPWRDDAVPPRFVLPDWVHAELAGARLAYDQGHLLAESFYAYGYGLDPTPVTLFDSRHEAPPAELVISTKHWPEAPAGARILFPDNLDDQALWVLPGALAERLRAAGRLYPTDLAADLPLPACRSEIAPDSAMPGSLHLAPGDRRPVVVRITNRGEGPAWVNSWALGGPARAVRLGVRWFRDGVLVASQRAELPRSLAPGESVPVRLDLSVDDALAPGRYEVRLGMVQELVRWFADSGDRELALTVTVSPG